MRVADSREFSHADFSIAAEAPQRARATFLRKTYAHLFGAIMALIGLEFLIFKFVDVKSLAITMLSGYNWLLVLAGFIGVSFIAEKWAASSVSLQKQYLGLGLYVLAEAVLFVPLLYFAMLKGGPQVISMAAYTTMAVFGGLTAIVFFTKKDFSFLQPLLSIGMIAALVFIVASIFLGFSLGALFSWLMVFLASGYILYETSEILNNYRVNQPVAAALALFASVALLFWYILQLFSRD